MQIKRSFKIISRFQRVRAARLNKIQYEINRATTYEQLMLMHNNTSNKIRQNDVFHTFMNLNFIDCTSERNDKRNIIRNINKRREKEREREKKNEFLRRDTRVTLTNWRCPSDRREISFEIYLLEITYRFGATFVSFEKLKCMHIWRNDRWSHSFEKCEDKNEKDSTRKKKSSLRYNEVYFDLVPIDFATIMTHTEEISTTFESKTPTEQMNGHSMVNTSVS